MIKEFPINTFKNLDMVLVLPRFNGKWALCSDNGTWKCPESLSKMKRMLMKQPADLFRMNVVLMILYSYLYGILSCMRRI